MRTLIALVALILLFVVSAGAQEAQSAFCNFDDDNQVSIQYKANVTEAPRNGKVWSPGITLYVQTPLTLGNSTLGLGAYSVHFVPDKKSWTIVVNKNVTAGAPMEIGELPAAQKNLQLAFGHMAPKHCSLRVYYQKTGAFAEFMEK